MLSRRKKQYNPLQVLSEAQKLLDSSQCLVGYRHVWHTLNMNGIQVPRKDVQELLSILDPEGCQMRRAHKLKRRSYHNAGPDAAWHVDGYDKVKRNFGFPIHACIDGWSRKVIWLKVTRSNNCPDTIASFYLDAVEQFGCPIQLITDLGTENGTMAALQSFFRNKENAHRYVPSTENQRIEAFWSFLRKSCTTWWINLFEDLHHQGILDINSPIHKDCLWFCFSRLIQKELDHLSEHWNTHRIRKSRFDTISGRPNALYYFPHPQGGMPDLAIVVPANDMAQAHNHLRVSTDENEHLEYFEYVVAQSGIGEPANWRESLQLYQWLLSVAQ